MSARSKHIASLVTVALLAVAMTALGQRAPTEETEQSEGTPVRASLLRPAMEKALPQPEALAIPEPPAGTWGVVASGTGGGAIFRDADSEAEVWVGSSGRGLWGFGSRGGGYFDSFGEDARGAAVVGGPDGTGIEAVGTSCGGVFAPRDIVGDLNAYARLGCWSPESGGVGVYSRGIVAAGEFTARNDTAWARLGSGDEGVIASGTLAGGHFQDRNGTGQAWVGTWNYGAQGSGSAAGGYFLDADSDNFMLAVYPTYKLVGNGTCAFVQNHPEDPSSVVVFAAPEGDEVATYTRGTARLRNGEARVLLGDTFRWVTNPDIGMTAHLSARGEPVPLAVVSLSTDELVVRAPAGAPQEMVFDYLVYGLRIGFERSTVVQEKRRAARIPSMRDHQAAVERRPELARYTALSRLTEQRQRVGNTVVQDSSRAEALSAAIQRRDPTTSAGDRLGLDPPQRMPDANHADVLMEAPAPRVARRRASAAAATPDSELSPVDFAAGDARARSFRPFAGGLSAMVPVTGEVAAGDVLVIRPDGSATRSDTASSTAVLGVVAADPGAVLGDEGRSELRAPLVFSGIAGCRVDARHGAIYPGDLLVTSPTPAHAMRSAIAVPGTVLGKALEEHTHGQGTIRVLVMLQ